MKKIYTIRIVDSISLYTEIKIIHGTMNSPTSLFTDMYIYIYIFVSRFDVSSVSVCITFQQFRQTLKKLIGNLHYTDEDHKSETIVQVLLVFVFHDYCKTSDHRMRIWNFNVVASSENWNLRTIESIYIQNNKRLLNINQSADPLYILKNQLMSVLLTCTYIYIYIWQTCFYLVIVH